jgi:hypothetical protein
MVHETLQDTLQPSVGPDGFVKLKL